MSSFAADFPLSPKTPSDVNRFTPVNSIQINKGSAPTLQVQLISRSALIRSARSDTESTDYLIHPEGSVIFHRDVVVSTQKITERHSTLGDRILNQCADAVANGPVTVFLEFLEHEHQVDYYIVVHRSKTITWIVGQEPESFKGAQAKHEYEYWIHMVNFPGPRFSTPEDLRSLKHELGSNPIDVLTAEGSTSPMSVEKIMGHLATLDPDPFSSEGDIHQTYAIAQLWILVLSRTTNKCENPGAVSENIIGKSTSIEEVIGVLMRRGCADITSSIDLTTCSDRPCAGGGFCDVYRGKLHRGTKIAIKSLRVYDASQLGGDDGSQKILKRAARELYHWSKLNHPNVLSLMGLAVFKGHVSMIPGWMDNGNLRQYLKQHPHINRIKLCIDVYAGLAYIHGEGMVHGDLKAANIMVSLSGVAMIGDFGNARLRDLTIKFGNTTSRSLSVRWAAPELIEGDGRPSKEADVYAYGMTVLETLTDKVPFEEVKNEQRVIHLVTIKNQVPPRPAAIMCNALWEILDLCWARDPSKRPIITSIGDRLETLLPFHSPMRACSQCTQIPPGQHVETNPRPAASLEQSQDRLEANMPPRLQRVEDHEDRPPFDDRTVSRLGSIQDSTGDRVKRPEGRKGGSTLVQVNGPLSETGDVAVRKTAEAANETMRDLGEHHTTAQVESQVHGPVRLLRVGGRFNLVLAFIFLMLCGLCLSSFGRIPESGHALSSSSTLHTVDFEERQIQRLRELLATVDRSLDDSKNMIYCGCMRETYEGGNVHS